MTAPISREQAHEDAARVFLEVLRTPTPQPVKKNPAA